MVNNCCIKGCPTKAGQGFKLHKIPKNVELRLKWCQFIESIDRLFVLKSSHAICENHFRGVDYTIPITSLHGQRILNKNAVPSLVGISCINLRRTLLPKSLPPSTTYNKLVSVAMPSVKYVAEKDHTYSSGLKSPTDSTKNMPVTTQNITGSSTSDNIISSKIYMPQLPTKTTKNSLVTTHNVSGSHTSDTVISSEISMPQLPIKTTQNSLTTAQNDSGNSTSDTTISNDFSMPVPYKILAEKDHTYSTELSFPKLPTELSQNISVALKNISESSTSPTVISNKLDQMVIPTKNIKKKSMDSTEISIPQLQKTTQNSLITNQNYSRSFTSDTVVPIAMSIPVPVPVPSKTLADNDQHMSYIFMPQPLTEFTLNIPNKFEHFKKGRRKVFVGDFKSIKDLDCPNDRLKYWYASQSVMNIQKQKLRKLNKEKNILYKQVQKLSNLLKIIDEKKKTINKNCNTDLKDLHSSSDDAVINKFTHTMEHNYSIVLKNKATLDPATICQQNTVKESTSLKKNSNIKNKLFSELNTLDLYLPPNWHKHLSRDKKYLAISEIIFIKKENEPTSFLRKNIIISQCLSITCNILGKNINTDKLINANVNIENKKQLENLIKEVNLLKICQGLHLINTKNCDPCSPNNEYFFDSMKIKRHLKCPMLIPNGICCSYCANNIKNKSAKKL